MNIEWSDPGRFQRKFITITSLQYRQDHESLALNRYHFSRINYRTTRAQGSRHRDFSWAGYSREILFLPSLRRHSASPCSTFLRRPESSVSHGSLTYCHRPLHRSLRGPPRGPASLPPSPTPRWRTYTLGTARTAGEEKAGEESDS